MDAWAKVCNVIKGKANRAGGTRRGADGKNIQYTLCGYLNQQRLPSTQIKADSTRQSVPCHQDGRVSDARHTPTNSDLVSTWFLQLGAPIFAAPLTCLFHQSLAMGVVPHQWKTAVITLIPKITTPA